VKSFAYVNAANQAEALASLSTERGKVLPLAGGMDLLAMMKDYVAQPDTLVNVKNLPSDIAVPAQGQITIGSAAKLVDVSGHAALAEAFPALVAAAGSVGTPQIRNLATVGGNLMQRPRCWYFRNEEFVCLKKGGSRCFAVDGENQFHAIFGDAPCHIVHPSTMALPIIAYGGRIRVAGPDGDDQRFELATALAREPTDITEVEDRHVVIIGQQEVPRMGIGVIEAVAEDHLQVHVRRSLHERVDVPTCRLHARSVRERLARDHGTDRPESL